MKNTPEAQHYLPTEVARWLLLPATTLRRWMAEIVTTKRHPEGLTLVPSVATNLSTCCLPFSSVVSAHNIKALLNHPGVSWATIRGLALRCDEAEAPCTLASSTLGEHLEGGSLRTHWQKAVATRLVFGVEYAPNGDPIALCLPTTHTQSVLRLKPGFGFGAPIFVRTSTQSDAVLSRWKAGESCEALADDYGIPLDHLQAAIRTHGRAAPSPNAWRRAPMRYPHELALK